MMPHYVRIWPSEPLPEIARFSPFKAVVILDGEYSSEWQRDVSDWLVLSGCLYVMAWGPNCSSWDDSVDWSNIGRFEGSEIPDENFVMTTWHDHESLESVFWFAGASAYHPHVELNETILLDVGQQNREAEFLELFKSAKTLPDREGNQPAR
jgi:hypothetical protein